MSEGRGRLLVWSLRFYPEVWAPLEFT